jgi:hypothetical protein
MSDNHAAPIVEKYLAKKPGDGTTFFRSEGWVSIVRGYADASNPEWLRIREPEGGERVSHRQGCREITTHARRLDEELLPLRETGIFSWMHDFSTSQSAGHRLTLPPADSKRWS